MNLIGEHTDYNGGYVLPVAIDRDVAVVARANGTECVSVFASNFVSRGEFSLGDIRSADPRSGESASRGKASWLDYFKGVAWALVEAGVRLVGMDAAVCGNVPIGSGLSSSAALEVAAALALLTVGGRVVEPTKLAKLCRQAENEYVGVGCGIMDQFASVHAARGSALFLDCSTLDFKRVPLPVGLARIIVCDTGVRRELAASAYNARRVECENALEILKRKMPHLKSLSDVTPEVFPDVERSLPEPLRQRARHVVSENGRVEDSVKALEAGDARRFGELMASSHESLRRDYEVSCRELDVMVEAARLVPGTYGARMTGAGFGGCTVNLVAPEAVTEFVRRVPEDYRRRTGIEPAVYVCETAQGAGPMALSEGGVDS